MDDSRPSFTRRAVAVIVLLIVAALAIRIVVGVISAVFWIVVCLLLIGATVWAVATLRTGRRQRSVKRSSSSQLPMTQEDRIDAEMRKLTEQLRDQGRL